MSRTVCLFGSSIHYPQGGGHLWVYLNWALGLRAVGCKVVWLEMIDHRIPDAEVEARVAAMKRHLTPYGLADALALTSPTGEPLSCSMAVEYLDLSAAAEADLLLNMVYYADHRIVERFRRSALIDIDPGLLQCWMTQGVIQVAPHDVYFTIGETVGHPAARFCGAGLAWLYTPPCVASEWWPTYATADESPFTTVSHWNTSEEWMKDAEGVYLNDKRAGFLPFLDLPWHTTQKLELALALANDQQERQALEHRGWSIRDAWAVASTPWDYQSYIQHSRGEFSCVKPSCVRLQNAWVSDRTLCYLASGKPAVIQYTGPSRFLPDAEGLLRFQSLSEAAECLETAAIDYEHHSRAARGLVQEYFDAQRVTTAVLERALE